MFSILYASYDLLKQSPARFVKRLRCAVVMKRHRTMPLIVCVCFLSRYAHTGVFFGDPLAFHDAPQAKLVRGRNADDRRAKIADAAFEQGDGVDSRQRTAVQSPVRKLTPDLIHHIAVGDGVEILQSRPIGKYRAPSFFRFRTLPS